MALKFETDQDLKPGEAIVIGRCPLGDADRWPGIAKGAGRPRRVIDAPGETVRDVVDLEAARMRRAG